VSEVSETSKLDTSAGLVTLALLMYALEEAHKAG